MRTPGVLLIAGALVAASAPARAEKPLFRETQRTERRVDAPLAITGGVVAGLGLVAVFASGITWTVAAAEASRLDDKCPNKKCVIGGDGAQSLESARDAETAAGVLFGIGFPAMTAGLVMLLYSASAGKPRTVPTLQAAPVVGPEVAGARVKVSF